MTQEDIEASFGTLLHGAGKIALLVLSHMGRDARDRVCFANLAAPADSPQDFKVCHGATNPKDAL
jgi:hypothetical protein